MARPSLNALIGRIRTMINDPWSPTSLFTDDQIADVLDEGRIDVVNGETIAKPTFTGSSIQYLNYYTELGGWEDDYVLKQYLTVPVTPSAVEPIAGHFQFALSTLPPIYISGKLHDIYRASADLLERLAARWVLRYDAGVDGQTLRRGQVTTALQALAKTYRLKQRPRTISTFRSDLSSHEESLSLAGKEIDYMSSGNG